MFQARLPIVSAGDSGHVEQKVLTLDHPNIERCFDACLRTNVTETPGGGAARPREYRASGTGGPVMLCQQH